MIDINNALILMIDMQEKLVNATNAELESNNASKIIKAGTILDIPIVVTEQYPKGLGTTIKDIKAHFDSKVKIYEKQAFSALYETEVLKYIEDSSKKQIILFGIELHICVLQTALDLISRGYEIFIIKNASKSRKSDDFEVALDLLKTKGATVLSIEMLLFGLLKTSKHPHFKEIQALIK